MGNHVLWPAKSFIGLDDHRLKTVAPIVICMGLWLVPLKRWTTGDKPWPPAARMAAKRSLILLELALPSVTTTIVQTFMCDSYGSEEDRFLRAQLTLRCNGFTDDDDYQSEESDRRKLFVSYAWAMFVVYPIGVPLCLFSLLYPHRKKIESLLNEVKAQDEVAANGGRLSISTIGQVARSEDNNKRRHRPSVIALSNDMMWLSSKFDKFEPKRWWMGVVLIIGRLLQTSLMVIFPAQDIQAAYASLIALLTTVLQQGLRPYRRLSDNDVAMYAGGVVFAWCAGRACSAWPVHRAVTSDYW